MAAVKPPSAGEEPGPPEYTKDRLKCEQSLELL